MLAPAMSLRTGWGSIVKSAKNLNATPGFSFFESILRPKAHMLINTVLLPQMPLW